MTTGRRGSEFAGDGLPQGRGEVNLSRTAREGSRDETSPPAPLSLPVSLPLSDRRPSPGFGRFRDRLSANSLALTASSTGDHGSGRSASIQSGSYSRADTKSSIGSPLSPVSSIDPSNVERNENGLVKPPDLHAQIWQASAWSVDTPVRVQFLPADQIERVICEENIRRELTGISDDVLRSIVPDRRKLFAILTMMGQRNAIHNFIQEGIHDHHLPFKWNENKSDVLMFRSNEGQMRVVKTLRNQWNSSHIYQFYATYQWQVLAPRLPVPCPYDSGPMAEMEPPVLLEQEILPFTEPVGGDPRYLYYRSGLSTVRKLCIHPAHRNRCLHIEARAGCLNAPFAVKIIDEWSNREMALGEIDKLKRFEGQKYRQRLIRLLCSFEYRRRFYLIFPWADANLEQFWQDKFPDVSNPRRGPGLARWVAAEMLGLARGLHLIHNPPPKNPNDKRTRGRHGDIKPDNILWFGDDTDPDLRVSDDGGTTMGILKICDFGLADFRSKVSVSMVEANRIGRTHAYCAPECEAKATVSPLYDSWSLGCVLLLFVTWYAQGWQGIDDFADRRRSQMGRVQRGVLLDDMFFQLDRLSKKVSMKPAVQQQINMLREHEECSELFLDVLSFIRDKLLKLEPHERARTDELVKSFQEIYDKCLRDEAYCTPRTRKVVASTAHVLDSPVVTQPAAAAGPAVTCQLDTQNQAWGRRVWSFIRALLAKCFRQ